MSRVARLARAVARGSWAFLIGDAPEFALAAGALVAFAVLLHRSSVAVVVGLPVLVVAVLAAGVFVGRRRILRQRFSSTATKASSGSPLSTSEQAQPVPSTSERSSPSDKNSHENHAEATWR